MNIFTVSLDFLKEAKALSEQSMALSEQPMA